MANVIIVLIIVILLVLALWKGRGHFKGECGCSPPGESTKEKKKLNGPICEERNVTISGMSCSHCADKVREAIEEIESCTAEVDFRKGRAHVSSDKPINQDELREKIEGAGYAVIGIE